MMCSLSQLDGSKLDQIRTAERRIGKTLLAYSCYETNPEELSDSELRYIQELERKLGLLLVAVK